MAHHPVGHPVAVAPVENVEASADELAVLVGPRDANRKLIEELLDIHVTVRNGQVQMSGAAPQVALAAQAVRDLLALIRRGHGLTSADVRVAARQVRSVGAPAAGGPDGPIVITHRGKPVSAMTAGQAVYVDAVLSHDLTFCLGPAGTGKTYLAMALAVAALREGTVSRIVLTRPIVEAGEALGFLPGDVMEKVDPYLRPLHDALHDIMGGERFRRNLDRGTIEVIPLAYMRGRTLNHCFIVLDEAQNTTPGQMKMALTRLGFGAKMVVTGDVTQTDLPATQLCGLRHAYQVLGALSGIACCELTGEDIVRHDLVQRIVAAYEDHAHESGRPDENGN